MGSVCAEGGRDLEIRCQRKFNEERENQKLESGVTNGV
jgi:hypothetical protein